MYPTYIRTGNAVEAEAYQQQAGPWTVANLSQSVGWAKAPAIIEFRGRTFLILPEDDSFLPGVATRGEESQGRIAILEFCSSLSWALGGAVGIHGWSGGNRPYRAGKNPRFGQITSQVFHIDYLPEPTDANSRLALALFHEGLALVSIHPAYSFLSFYKIVNLVSGHKGAAQIAWINARLSRLKHPRSKGRLTELRKIERDIGKYMYQSCRCAIAHAGDPRNPVIDPHRREDEQRMRSDLPVIVSLAEMAIEEMGIQTSATVILEHKYELSGFERLIPDSLLDKLKAGDAVQLTGLQLAETFSLRIWGQPNYPPLEGMVPTEISSGAGKVIINCASRFNGIFAKIILDFQEYRLSAEVSFGAAFKDDGTSAFVEAIRDVERFYWDWNGNGCLEVWRDSSDCVGRCDPFIPVNVFLDFKAHDARVAQLEKEILRRTP